MSRSPLLPDPTPPSQGGCCGRPWWVPPAWLVRGTVYHPGSYTSIRADTVPFVAVAGDEKRARDFRDVLPVLDDSRGTREHLVVVPRTGPAGWKACKAATYLIGFIAFVWIPVVVLSNANLEYSEVQPFETQLWTTHHGQPGAASWCTSEELDPHTRHVGARDDGDLAFRVPHPLDHDETVLVVSFAISQRDLQNLAAPAAPVSSGAPSSGAAHGDNSLRSLALDLDVAYTGMDLPGARAPTEHLWGLDIVPDDFSGAAQPLTSSERVAGALAADRLAFSRWKVAAPSVGATLMSLGYDANFQTLGALTLGTSYASGKLVISNATAGLSCIAQGVASAVMRATNVSADSTLGVFAWTLLGARGEYATKNGTVLPVERPGVRVTSVQCNPAALSSEADSPRCQSWAVLQPSEFVESARTVSCILQVFITLFAPGLVAVCIERAMRAGHRSSHMRKSALASSLYLPPVSTLPAAVSRGAVLHANSYLPNEATLGVLAQQAPGDASGALPAEDDEHDTGHGDGGKGTGSYFGSQQARGATTILVSVLLALSGWLVLRAIVYNSVYNTQLSDIWTRAATWSIFKTGDEAEYYSEHGPAQFNGASSFKTLFTLDFPWGPMTLVPFALYSFRAVHWLQLGLWFMGLNLPTLVALLTGVVLVVVRAVPSWWARLTTLLRGVSGKLLPSDAGRRCLDALLDFEGLGMLAPGTTERVVRLTSLDPDVRSGVMPIDATVLRTTAREVSVFALGTAVTAAGFTQALDFTSFFEALRPVPGLRGCRQWSAWLVMFPLRLAARLVPRAILSVPMAVLALVLTFGGVAASVDVWKALVAREGDDDNFLSVQCPRQLANGCRRAVNCTCLAESARSTRSGCAKELFVWTGRVGQLITWSLYLAFGVALLYLFLFIAWVVFTGVMSFSVSATTLGSALLFGLSGAFIFSETTLPWITAVVVVCVLLFSAVAQNTSTMLQLKRVLLEEYLTLSASRPMTVVLRSDEDARGGGVGRWELPRASVYCDSVRRPGWGTYSRAAKTLGVASLSTTYLLLTGVGVAVLMGFLVVMLTAVRGDQLGEVAAVWQSVGVAVGGLVVKFVSQKSGSGMGMVKLRQVARELILQDTARETLLAGIAATATGGGSPSAMGPVGVVEIGTQALRARHGAPETKDTDR